MARKKVDNEKVILAFLKKHELANPGEMVSRTKVALETKIHFYLTRAILENLHTRGILQRNYNKNRVYYILKKKDENTPSDAKDKQTGRDRSSSL